MSHLSARCGARRLPLASLLLALVFVTLGSAADSGPTGPELLFAERGNTTYTYIMHRVVNTETGKGVLWQRPYLAIEITDSTDVSIYTEDMQRAVVQALQSSPFAEDVDPPEASEPFSGACGLTNSGTACVKAFLRVSVDSTCTKADPRCCDMYWVTDTQAAGLPIYNVKAHTVFWRDQQPYNGFYTNFSTTTAPSCKEAGKPLHSPLALAVDIDGAWVWVNASYTYFSLRELNVEKSTNATIKEQGRAFTSQVLGTSSTHYSVNLATPIAVCAILLGLLVLLLIVFTALERCRCSPSKGEENERSAELLQSIRGSRRGSTLSQQMHDDDMDEPLMSRHPSQTGQLSRRPSQMGQLSRRPSQIGQLSRQGSASDLQRQGSQRVSVVRQASQRAPPVRLASDLQGAGYPNPNGVSYNNDFQFNHYGHPASMPMMQAFPEAGHFPSMPMAIAYPVEGPPLQAYPDDSQYVHSPPMHQQQQQQQQQQFGNGYDETEAQPTLNTARTRGARRTESPQTAEPVLTRKNSMVSWRLDDMM